MIARFVQDGKAIDYRPSEAVAAGAVIVQGNLIGIARLDIARLFAVRLPEATYHALPRFPASTRDLAVICDESLPVAAIEKTIAGAVGNILEQIKLFDVYRGAPVPAGKKSVAYSLVLRAADRTLTVEECDKAIEKALKALSQYGITLRA